MNASNQKVQQVNFRGTFLSLQQRVFKSISGIHKCIEIGSVLNCKSQ